MKLKVILDPMQKFVYVDWLKVILIIYYLNIIKAPLFTFSVGVRDRLLEDAGFEECGGDGTAI